MSESAQDYFERMNDWEESFETLQDFIDLLSIPGNQSGALGRVAAKTIIRLQKEVDDLKASQNNTK